MKSGVGTRRLGRPIEEISWCDCDLIPRLSFYSPYMPPPSTLLAQCIVKQLFRSQCWSVKIHLKKSHRLSNVNTTFDRLCLFLSVCIFRLGLPCDLNLCTFVFRVTGCAGTRQYVGTGSFCVKLRVSSRKRAKILLRDNDVKPLTNERTIVVQ